MTTTKIYRLGERLTFNSGSGIEAYLASGWSTPEKARCWTVGPTAVLSLNIQSGAASAFLLRLECTPYVGSGVTQQTVTVLVNDEKVATWEVRATGWYEAPVAYTALQTGAITVAFSVSHPTAPSSDGVTTDPRLLGLYVRSFEIVRTDAGCPNVDDPKIVWLGSGLDPVGNVFKKNGKYYRAIKHGATAQVKKLIAEGAYHHLALRKLIPEHQFWEIEHPDYSMVAGIDAGIVFPSSSYPLLALQAAARVWLDINDCLMDVDGHFGLIDGHSGNFALFDNSRPMWIDMGSIGEAGGQFGDPHFGRSQFIRCYIYPLLMIARRPQDTAAIRQLMSEQPDGITDAQFEARVLEGFDLGPLANPQNRIERRAVLRHLREVVDGIDFSGVKGFWSGYRKAEQLEWALQGGPLQGDADPRFKAVADLVERSGAKSFIDLGANDGLFSLLFVRNGAKGIAVDLDDFALNKLYQFLSEHPGIDMVVAQGTFSNVPHMAEVVLALALTHHLNLSQGLSFADISASLAKNTSHAAITEFMPFGLGGTADIVGPFPDPLPAHYTLDEFIAALKVDFRHVEVVDYARPNAIQVRTLLYCEGPKHV